MEGTIVHAVFQSSVQIGENITFDVKDAVKDTYFMKAKKVTGEQILIPKSSVKAHSPEDVEDISFLNDLSKEIQNHEKIIIFPEFPFGGSIYAFEDENPLLVLNKDFACKKYRGLFTDMIQDIALEEGKDVFVAYLNAPDKGYTLKQVTSLLNGLKAEKFVCIKPRSLSAFDAFKNFGKEGFSE